jgi:hypothetical protein
MIYYIFKLNYHDIELRVLHNISKTENDPTIKLDIRHD